jgi:hypothetical protein
MIDKIHDLPVLGWIQTETQTDGIRCGYILVQTRRFASGPEFCTGWYREGEKEWSSGNYFGKITEAVKDLHERAIRALHTQVE